MARGACGGAGGSGATARRGEDERWGVALVGGGMTSYSWTTIGVFIDGCCMYLNKFIRIHTSEDTAHSDVFLVWFIELVNHT